MNAIFAMSNILTVLTDNSVYSVKCPLFESEVVKFKEIEFKGWFSIAKFNKYVAVLLANGFTESTVIYKDFKKDGSIDFYLTFSKQ